MARQKVYVRVVLTNLKAVKALAFAQEILQDAQESLPWSTDIGKAIKALKYAAKHLQIRLESDNAP